MTTLERPTERDIYTKLWQEHPEYREVSPGEGYAQEFLAQARPKPGSLVLDIGCGTGRGGLMLAFLGGLNVTLIDFAANCLDDDIQDMLTTQAHALRFVEADITQPLPVAAPYAFCSDVMEHIPPSQVDAVLDNCLHAAQHCFFMISTQPDVMGALVGHPLHLSVHPFDWWLSKFRERGCVIHWSRDYEGQRCAFYASAWQDGQALVDVGVLNTAEEAVIENVRINTAGGWNQVMPHETNDVEVMILGGGPSLAEFEEEIRERAAAGVKIITLNGAYNWCMERGIGPLNQIICDARPFNARFVQPIDPKNLYLIASQCDPSVFERLPQERTFIWHTSAEMIRETLDAAHEIWYGIPGGSTVLLRAIPLLRLLGFKRFTLYGCDSCLVGGAHHAFKQTENDEALSFPVTVGGRLFQCYPWMASQATEFIQLIKILGNEIEFEVRGDGLLAWIIQHGYDMETERQQWRYVPRTGKTRSARAKRRRRM